MFSIVSNLIKRKLNKSRKSFTLIELLVVIAIIGLLASIVLVNTGSARLKARDARRLNDLQQLRTALEMYYSNYNRYPSDGTINSIPPCDLIGIDGQNDALTVALRNAGILSGGLTDPKIGSDCVYYYGAPSWWWSCGKAYQLEMRFETQEGARLADEAGGDCNDYSGGYNWNPGTPCAGYNCAFPSP